MKMHKLLWKILSANHKSDFTIFFALLFGFLDFQYTKHFLGKVIAALETSYFSITLNPGFL